MIGEWEKIDKKNYYAWRRWRSFRAAGLFDKQRRKSNVHKAVPGRLQEVFIDTRFGLENILCVHHVHGKRYGLFPVGPRKERGDIDALQKRSEYDKYEHFEIGEREINHSRFEGKVFGKQ